MIRSFLISTALVASGAVVILFVSGFAARLNVYLNGGEPDLLKVIIPNDINSDEIRVVGEAFFASGQSKPDDRCRVIALTDALRKIAVIQSGERNSGLDSDSVICERDWKDINLKTVSTYKWGVMVSDEVIVVADAGPNNSNRWRIVNLKLTEPTAGHNPQLASLTEAILACGFDLTGSRRVGSNVWQEELSTRRWNR